ncbi:MAG: carbohydrate ABC transporter permease, partial [Acutalibacteraceae bacterium]
MKKAQTHKLKESGYFHKGHLSLMGKRAVAGYMFVLPLIIGIIAVFIPSMIDSVKYSINEIAFTPQGYDLTPVGWDYYKKITSDVWYINELKNTAIMMVYNVPLITLFSFFMAIILNQNFKGRTAARAILFLPVIISAGCILKVEDTSALTGLIEAGDTIDAINSMDITNFLIGIGIPPTICETLSGIMSNIYEVISQSGVQILIFLAALQTIPSSLYEASTVEGATGWESFWKITFPMLSPYIL